MMHKCRILHMLAYVISLKYLVTLSRMSLNHEIFSLRQLLRLLDDRLGYLELTYIMKDTTLCCQTLLLLIESHPSCEYIADESHIHAMSKGDIVIGAHIMHHIKHIDIARRRMKHTECIRYQFLRIKRSIPKHHVGNHSAHLSDSLFKFLFELLEFRCSTQSGCI